MSAIPCSSVSMRTMADGTLRLSIDIEPANAQDAFRLFAAPGTPAAIAALQVGYAAAGEPSVKESLTPETPKGGALAKLAGMWCADKTFQAWLETDPDNAAPNESGATLCLYALCEIEREQPRIFLLAKTTNDGATYEMYGAFICGAVVRIVVEVDRAGNAIRILPSEEIEQ